MSNRLLYVATLVLVVLIGGCASMSEGAKTGATAGGLLGAAAGGIIGHQSGSGWEGAAIGAATGAVAGGLIGDKMEQSRESNPNHLRITEIAEMAKAGVPGEVIIDEIERTGSVYYLSSETITYLKDNGVSDEVINYMMATGQK